MIRNSGSRAPISTLLLEAVSRDLNVVYAGSVVSVPGVVLTSSAAAETIDWIVTVVGILIVRLEILSRWSYPIHQHH